MRERTLSDGAHPRGRRSKSEREAARAHAKRCALPAQRLGLGYQNVDLIRRASTLHDAGKIGVPDAILLKPGRLTAEEFEVVKTHTVIVAAFLEVIKRAEAG